MDPEFILETHGLTKQFAGFYVVRDVNLQVRKGTIHALIGPNGAGKTTCFNPPTKFLQPSEGQIIYRGKRYQRAAELLDDVGLSEFANTPAVEIALRSQDRSLRDKIAIEVGERHRQLPRRQLRLVQGKVGNPIPHVFGNAVPDPARP